MDKLRDRIELKETVDNYEAVLEGKGVSSFSDPDAREFSYEKDRKNS